VLYSVSQPFISFIKHINYQLFSVKQEGTSGVKMLLLKSLLSLCPLSQICAIRRQGRVTLLTASGTSERKLGKRL